MENLRISFFVLLVAVFIVLAARSNPIDNTTSTIETIIPRIAERKCFDYSGIIRPYILGGDRVRPPCPRNNDTREFPHMAHLGYGEKPPYSFECGASLISHKFLLTAAHCVKPPYDVPAVARLGTDNVHSNGKVVKIVEKFYHPDHKQPYDDIALLRLEKPVKFTKYIRPACIQVEEEIEETEGIAIGWGRIDKKNFSDDLLKVKVPFVDHSECSKVYKPHAWKLPAGLDEKKMLCAGYFNVTKDACAGDSGGPLQIKINGTCKNSLPVRGYSIVGVTSFGRDCGVNPGVYTRVSNYVSWIESIVWPDEENTIRKYDSTEIQ